MSQGRNRTVQCPAVAPSRQTRGVAFVVTLLAITVLVAMCLAFARQMRVEALASSNHAAMVEARWIARGALEAVRGELARSRQVNAVPDLQSVGVEGVPIGGGFYWLIRPDFENGRQHAFGLIGEAGKINVNIATVESLVELPRMSEEIAAAIVDWRDADSEVTPGGAESEYYLTLADPHHAKDGAFETVAELLLVRGVTEEMMFGEDDNRSGVMDASEDESDGRFERGLFDLVTVYSSQPNDGLVNINQPSAELTELLRQTLSEQRFAQVAGLMLAARPPYRNTLDFCVRAKLTPDEFEVLHDRITTWNQPAVRGLVDVYEAPAEVLDAVEGLEAGDGELIVGSRPTPVSGQSPPPLTWLIDVLGQGKAVAAASRLTHRSFQFTADVMAVTGDGRGFCRLRAVLDASPVAAEQSSPPAVLHVADLSSLGWPLQRQIIDRLRRGEPLETSATVPGGDGT